MAIPQYFLDELKSRVAIEDVISSYVNLKRRGKNLLGLCPFHNEKTPSFNVSTDNGYFHCFGCGAGGDVITFIMKIENLDYIEAVKFLASKAGLEIPESSNQDATMSNLRTRVLEINRETARFYHNCLVSKDGEKAQNYFNDRQMSIKTVRHFGLGYAPEGGFALVNHLKKLGYSNDELVTANVAFLSRNGNPVDRFYDRVMFPIIDLRGNVVAFGGRILNSDKSKAKYINTSDTPVFHKSNGLFAMNFAKNSTDRLILAEGYMDVIALHQAGFTGAIASLGTAFTPEQARLISKYTKEIVICYDSDSAGQKATQRAIPILRNAGLQVRVLCVPNGKDPDEFIKSAGKDGAVKFNSLLQSCETDVEYRMRAIRQECDMETEVGKVKYLTECAKMLGTLENSIERDVYMGKLSQELGVDKSAIGTQVNKTVKSEIKQKQIIQTREKRKELTGVGDRVIPEKASNLRIANAEEAIISFIFTDEYGIEYCKKKLPADKLFTAFSKRIYKIVLEKNTDKIITLTDLSADLTEAEMSSLSRILMKFSEIKISRRDVDEYINLILQESMFATKDSIKKAETKDLAEYLKNLKQRKQ